MQEIWVSDQPVRHWLIMRLQGRYDDPIIEVAWNTTYTAKRCPKWLIALLVYSLSFSLSISSPCCVSLCIFLFVSFSDRPTDSLHTPPFTLIYTVTQKCARLITSSLALIGGSLSHSVIACLSVATSPWVHANAGLRCLQYHSATLGTPRACREGQTTKV